MISLLSQWSTRDRDFESDRFFFYLLRRFNTDNRIELLRTVYSQQNEYFLRCQPCLVANKILLK